MTDEAVEKAKTEVDAARVRLFATVQEIQSRLEPSSLLDDAVTNVRVQSARIAQDAGDTIRERPALFGGAVVAGTLLLVRRPLLRLGRRLFGGDKRTRDETERDAAG